MAETLEQRVANLESKLDGISGYYQSDLTGSELDKALQAALTAGGYAADAVNNATQAAQSRDSALSSASAAAASEQNAAASEQNAAASEQNAAESEALSQAHLNSTQDIAYQVQQQYNELEEREREHDEIMSHLVAVTDAQAAAENAQEAAETAQSKAEEAEYNAETSEISARASAERSELQANRSQDMAGMSEYYSNVSRDYADQILSAESGVVFTTDFQTSRSHIQLVNTLKDLVITGTVYGETYTHQLSGKNLFNPYDAYTVEELHKTIYDESDEPLYTIDAVFYKFIIRNLNPELTYIVATNAPKSEHASYIYAGDLEYGECYGGYEKPVLPDENGNITIYVRSDSTAFIQKYLTHEMSDNDYYNRILVGECWVQVEESKELESEYEPDGTSINGSDFEIYTKHLSDYRQYQKIGGVAENGKLFITGRNMLVPAEHLTSGDYALIVNGSEVPNGYSFPQGSLENGEIVVNGVASAGSAWYFGKPGQVGKPWMPGNGPLIQVKHDKKLTLSNSNRNFNILGLCKYDINGLCLGSVSSIGSRSVTMAEDPDCHFVTILFGHSADAGETETTFSDYLQLEYGDVATVNEFGDGNPNFVCYAAQEVGPLFADDRYLITTSAETSGTAYKYNGRIESFDGSDSQVALLRYGWLSSYGESADGNETLPTIGSQVVYTIRQAITVHTTQGAVLTKGNAPDTFSCEADMLLNVPSALLAVKEATTASENFREIIQTGGGLFRTQKTDTVTGAVTYYFHDQSDIATSSNIYVLNANGFAWTDNWNDGNPEWEYGMAHGGEAMLNYLNLQTLVSDTIDAKTINAGLITADDIKTGRLEAKNGKSYFDLDTGELVVNGGSPSGDAPPKSTIVTGIQVEYYLSTSTESTAGGEWVTTAPNWVDGKYMWSRTKTSYADGHSTYTPSENGTCIAGATGQPGNNGTSVTIKSTSVEYAVSSDGIVAPTTGWSGSGVPEVSQGQYLWTKTTVEYNPSGSTVAYSVAYKGTDGGKGEDGKSYYTHIRYSTNSDGTGFVAAPTASTLYIGVYTGVSATAPTDKGQYKWSKYVGDTGPAGNGITAVTAEFYLSNSKTALSGGSWSTTAPTWNSGKYIWTRTKITYSDKDPEYTTPICDSSWEAVNDLSVGGTNLYTGSKDFSGSWVNFSNWSKQDEDYNGFTVMKKSTAWGGLAQNIQNPKVGDQYTLSFYGKVESGGDITSIHRSSLGNVVTGLSIVGGNGVSNAGMYRWVSSAQDGSEWKRYWATVEITGDLTNGSDNYLQWRIENTVANKSLYVCGFKLERGNKATDWSPNPNDLTNSLAAGTTTINGACISTGIIKSNAEIEIDGVSTPKTVIDLDNGIVKMQGEGSVIDAGKVEVNNINASNIVAGQLNAEMIITAGEIDAGIVDVKNLNAKNITTGAIGTFTNGTLDKTKSYIEFINGKGNISLNGGDVATGTLSANQITAGKLQSKDGKTYFDLTNNKLVVEGGEIKAGTISGASITGGSISSNTTISGATINAGTVSGATITGGTLIADNGKMTVGLSSGTITSSSSADGVGLSALLASGTLALRYKNNTSDSYHDLMRLSSYTGAGIAPSYGAILTMYGLVSGTTYKQRVYLSSQGWLQLAASSSNGPFIDLYDQNDRKLFAVNGNTIDLFQRNISAQGTNTASIDGTDGRIKANYLQRTGYTNAAYIPTTGGTLALVNNPSQSGYSLSTHDHDGKYVELDSKGRTPALDVNGYVDVVEDVFAHGDIYCDKGIGTYGLMDADDTSKQGAWLGSGSLNLRRNKTSGSSTLHPYIRFWKTGDAYSCTLRMNYSPDANITVNMPKSNGTLTVTSSDVRLKANIKDSTVKAVDTLNKLKVREFDWVDETYSKEKHWPVGLVADEMEEIDPIFSVGGDTEDEYKSVNLWYINGYLIKAVQELSAEIDRLKEKLGG